MPSRSILRNIWIPLAVVFAIGVETRFVGLSDRSLWFDEAFSVSLARIPVPAIVQFLRGNNDTHPPLYYALLNAWIHLFGPSEVAVRSLSALIGLLMVPLLYGFARRLVDRDVALVASALLAGSAFAVHAAQEARMYPLLGLLALGSWFSLLRAVQSRRARDWALYAACSALMLYTHYFGFLVLGSQALYLAPRWRRDPRALRDALLALGAVAVLFAPWVPTLLAQTMSGRGWPTFRPPADAHGLAALLALFGFGGELFGMSGYFHTALLPVWREALVTVPLLGLVGAGMYALRGDRAWLLGCYWAAPIAAAIVVSHRVNIFYPRYFSFLAPPFALLLAAGIDLTAVALLRCAKRGLESRPAALVGCAVIVLAVNAPVINGYTSGDYAEFDWRSAAELVTAAAGPRDYLLFVPGFAETPFEYYYRGSQERFRLTPIEIFQMVRVKKAADPKLNKDWAHHLAQDHPRVWIIATVPLPGSAFLRLRTLLGDDFGAGQAWDFHSVYVIGLPSLLYRANARKD